LVAETLTDTSAEIFFPSPRMIITGWRRALRNSDLWSLNPSDRSQTVATKLAENWQKQVEKTRSTIDDVMMTIII